MKLKKNSPLQMVTRRCTHEEVKENCGYVASAFAVSAPKSLAIFCNEVIMLTLCRNSTFVNLSILVQFSFMISDGTQSHFYLNIWNVLAVYSSSVH